MKVVNGFPCANGCDESVARKGIDPRNPRNDPVKQAQLDAKDPRKAASPDDGRGPGAVAGSSPARGIDQTAGPRVVEPTGAAAAVGDSDARARLPGLGRFVDVMA